MAEYIVGVVRFRHNLALKGIQEYISRDESLTKFVNFLSLFDTVYSCL